MNIIMSIVSVVIFTTFVAVVFIIILSFFQEHRFLKTFDELRKRDGTLSNDLDVGALSRNNIKFAFYILRKKYEHEKNMDLKIIGSTIYKLHLTGYILTLITIALLVFIFLVGPT